MGNAIHYCPNGANGPCLLFTYMYMCILNHQMRVQVGIKGPVEEFSKEGAR